MQLRELTYMAIGIRILAALVLGGIIGLEREMKNRPAGRTTARSLSRKRANLRRMRRRPQRKMTVRSLNYAD